MNNHVELPDCPADGGATARDNLFAAARSSTPVIAPTDDPSFSFGLATTCSPVTPMPLVPRSAGDSVSTKRSDPAIWMDNNTQRSAVSPASLDSAPFSHALPSGRGRPYADALSRVPFPALSCERFGLIQEVLAEEPFQLLIAVTLLNRTHGAKAIPAFFELLNAYPTPTDLALADVVHVASMIRHLGLQNIRARRCIELARTWVMDPPLHSRRHRSLHYPTWGAGRDIVPGEIVADNLDDPREGAFEIAHLPSAGPYALDSWRIFCRDRLRGIATGWNGQGAASTPFEPEWKRVVPLDKELRAFLQWMWLKEGWLWDPSTGQKTRAVESLAGNVDY